MHTTNLLLILTLFLTPVSVFSQAQGNVTKLNILEKGEKPSVYLDYVCRSSEKFFLRMVNNSQWNIVVTADKLYFPTKRGLTLMNGASVYALPNDEEISTIYFATEKDELAGNANVKIPPSVVHYSRGGGWIPPTDSILLSIPSDHLREGLSVFVYFNYEWEATRTGVDRDSPQHRVYVSGRSVANKKSANCNLKGVGH